MNNALKITLLAALAVAAASCTQKTAAPDAAQVSPQITAGVGTRADGSLWTADQIGVTVSAAPLSTMASDYVNVGYSTEASSVSTASFDPVGDPIVFEDSDETVTFTAYAPFEESSAISVLPGDDSDGVITSSTSSQTTSDAQAALDYLYAGAETATEAHPKVNFTFAHVMSLLEIRLVSAEGYEASDIQDGTYSIDGLIHDGAFDVNPADASTCGTAYITGTEATDGWDLATGASSSDTETGITYTCILYPQTLSSLHLNAYVNDIPYTGLNLLPYITSGSLEAGHSYTFTVEVAATHLVVEGCTVSDWINENATISVGGNDDTGATSFTVYANDFDHEIVSDNLPITSTITAYMNEYGTGASDVEYGYSSTMSVRISYASNGDNGYDGGSGGNNIFFGNSDLEYFIIGNIALDEGVTDYILSFAGFESGAAFEHDNFKVYLSEDGESWVQISYTFANGDPQTSWDVATSAFSVSSGTTTLYIYFESDKSSTFRIDDVSLVTSETAGTEIDFTDGIELPGNVSGGGESEELHTLTSNVSWTVSSDDHSYDYQAHINGSAETYELLKLGASGKTGSATCTIPEGSTSLAFYVVGWNTYSNIPYTVTVGSVTSYSGTVDGNVGFSGTSTTYDLTISDNSDYHVIEFDALSEETTVTFATTSTSPDPRAGFFGVNYYTD